METEHDCIGALVCHCLLSCTGGNNDKGEGECIQKAILMFGARNGKIGIYAEKEDAP